MENLLKKYDVAAMLGVSIRTVDRLIADGDLPVTRIGRSVRIRPEELRQYVSRKTVMVKAAPDAKTAKKAKPETPARYVPGMKVVSA